MVVKNTDSGHELLGSKFLPARVLDDLGSGNLSRFLEDCKGLYKIL